VRTLLAGWLGPLAASTIFAVMLSLGLLLGYEQAMAALRRRTVIAAIAFAVVVPVPLLAVLAVLVLGVKGPVAAGIVLMAISPGAPVALRRAIEVGRAHFAPALHLSIVILAVVTVPGSIALLRLIFGTTFTVSPLEIARQVFAAQLLPFGLGVLLRSTLPALAARIEPALAGLGNVLLLLVAGVGLFVLWPLLRSIGWTPIVVGGALTVTALLVGAGSAWRDREARPQAAVAAAMRNPGLAIFVATVNNAPPTVTAAVFGYAVGAAVVISAFVAWRSRAQRPARVSLHDGGPDQ